MGSRSAAQLEQWWSPLKRLLPFIAVAGALLVLSGCGKSDQKQATEILQKASPEANWDKALSMTADVTCDGQPDTVLVGHRDDAVWLGVVQKSKPVSDAPLVVKFAIGAKDQGAFCANPVKITRESLVCDNEGGKLPGCLKVEGCSAFTVAEETCDPFHFYWDNDRKSLTWWRR